MSRFSARSIKTASRRGMTLVELTMALAMACLVGSGVVAMTESVGRVLMEGRIQKENTTASATASSRLAAVVSTASCPLMLSPQLVVCWGTDLHRDGRIQASELRWIRFDDEDGTLHLEQIGFPDDFGPRDIERADRTFASDADFRRVRRQFSNEGLLDSRMLLDGLVDVELAMSRETQADPIDQKRISWRLQWSEEATPHSEAIITCAIHAHSRPEDF